MAPAEPSRAELKVAVKTDVGMVRDHNEDTAFVDPNHRFFIVADGMGGHAAGEVASAMAVDVVRQELENATSLMVAFEGEQSRENRVALISALEEAVISAHQAVFDRGSEEPDKQGMGTTLDAVIVAGGEAFVAHVGDSRTYRLREETIDQITTDHTVAEVWMIEGRLKPEEAANSHLRTILVNAIGVAADVGVELAELQLLSGDRLLLCSDGLHDYFPANNELLEQTQDSGGVEESLDLLVDVAKQRGGADNITGILIEVVSAPRSPTSADSFAKSRSVEAVPAAVAHEMTQPIPENNDPSAPYRTTEEIKATDSSDDSDAEDDSDASDDEPGTSADNEDGRPEVLPVSDTRTTVPIRPILRKPNADDSKD